MNERINIDSLVSCHLVHTGYWWPYCVKN